MVVVNGAALFDRDHDRQEVVVGKDHVRDALVPERRTAGSPPLTALTPHKLGERTHPPNVAAVRMSRRGTRRADGGDIEKSCVETIHHNFFSKSLLQSTKDKRQFLNIVFRKQINIILFISKLI